MQALQARSGQWGPARAGIGRRCGRVHAAQVLAFSPAETTEAVLCSRVTDAHAGALTAALILTDAKGGPTRQRPGDRGVVHNTRGPHGRSAPANRRVVSWCSTCASRRGRGEAAAPVVHMMS
jgi:hypothetical protein